MHLASIDYMANSGISFLHRAKPIVKLIMAIIFVICFIITNNLIELFVLIFIIFAFMVVSKVDLRELMHLALYPVFFSMIFALISLRQSWLAALIVMLKALGTAWTMLLLITTTSYVDIFSIFSLIMPSIIVDIFIFTYRSLFILLDEMEKVLRNIKLRGGFNPRRILFNAKNISGAMGLMIINAIDMSERLYHIYALRGYNGNMSLTTELWPLKFYEIILIIIAVLVLIGVIIPWIL